MTASGPAPGSRGLKLLYLTAETWPTFRVDVAEGDILDVNYEDHH